MNSNIYGYIGTDTMPTCTNGLCWFIHQQPYVINEEQLNFFKVDGVAANARMFDQSEPDQYSRLFLFNGLFAQE